MRLMDWSPGERKRTGAFCAVSLASHNCLRRGKLTHVDYDLRNYTTSRLTSPLAISLWRFV